jgi:DNA invertase Pin-like site-specific DNA recombinase
VYHNKKTNSHPTAGMAVSIHQSIATASIVVRLAKIQDIDPKRIALAKSLYADQNTPVQEICETLHISKSTLYRYVGKKTNLDRPIERLIEVRRVVQGGRGE